MSRIFFLAALALAGIATNCLAQEPPSVREITKQIIRAVKNYADGIACEAYITPKTIAALAPYKTSGDRDAAKFAVVWSGDIGCLGGSGANQNYIAIVTVGPNGHFRVVPALSSPAIKFAGFAARDFPKLVGNTKDTLILDGLDYNPAGGDGMCCPSIPIRLTVRVDEKGNWVTIDKKVKVSRENAQPIIPPDAAR